MFGNTIRCLPYCTSYEGAARIWDQRPVPRNKAKWPERMRPLDDARKEHYAIVKDGDRYFFKLYRTNVVIWHSRDHITLDSSYDSAATRNFADRYLPNGISFGRQKEEGYTVKTKDDEFCRGIHDFRRADGAWECVSPTLKPKRSLLDPHEKKRIRAVLKPLHEWVKGLWGISGNDGSHPWKGQEMEAGSKQWPVPKFDLALLAAGDHKEMEKLVLQYLPTARTWNQHTRFWYTPVDSADLLANINKAIYRQEGAYIKIDYDAPLPRLKEKK